MTYALAKQLKEAGFPQSKTGATVYFYGNGSSAGYQREFTADEIKIPTLSELIEACGDRLSSLYRNKDGDFIAEGGGYNCGQVSTPDVAVAQLWLALHQS